MSYRNATRIALAYVVLLVLLSATLLCVGEDANASVQGYSVHVRHASETATLARSCAEDDPCFTWSTMGNLERGLYVKRGRSVPRAWGAYRAPWGAWIVDASVFCRMERARLIDWHRSPRLRGDSLAREHGCDARLFAQPGE